MNDTGRQEPSRVLPCGATGTVLVQASNIRTLVGSETLFPKDLTALCKSSGNQGLQMVFSGSLCFFVFLQISSSLALCPLLLSLPVCLILLPALAALQLFSCCRFNGRAASGLAWLAGSALPAIAVPLLRCRHHRFAPAASPFSGLCF